MKVGSSNLPPATIELSPTSETLVKTLWSLRNLSQNTQKSYAKFLKHLNQHADLNDPENVERYVFNKNWKNKSRTNYFNAYQHYCKAADIEWYRPKLRNERYPVRVPTEEKINIIIGQATPRYATIYHISKHGLRPDEISKIQLRDIDFERGTLLVRTSKLGLERNLQLKPEATDLLKEYARARWYTRNLQSMYGLFHHPFFGHGRLEMGARALVNNVKVLGYLNQVNIPLIISGFY